MSYFFFFVFVQHQVASSGSFHAGRLVHTHRLEHMQAPLGASWHVKGETGPGSTGSTASGPAWGEHPASWPCSSPPPPCLSCLLCAAAALQPCTCPGLAACGLPRRGLKGHPRTGPEPGCLAQVSGTAVRVGGSELASWSSSSKSCLKGPVDSGASPQVSRRSRCASCGSVAAVPPWPPAPQPPTALLPVPPSGTPSRWLTPSLCLEPVSAVWSLFLPETGARA